MRPGSKPRTAVRGYRVIDPDCARRAGIRAEGAVRRARHAGVQLGNNRRPWAGSAVLDWGLLRVGDSTISASMEY